MRNNGLTRQPIEILLVEDSIADAELTSELLAEAQTPNRVHRVDDGVAALHRLRGVEPFRPDLIILDLNLPRMKGLELLAALKQDAQLRAIPVVVLTMSRAESDVQAAYAQQAAAFITKPVGLEQFAQVVRAIDAFWLGVVRLRQRDD